MMVFQLDGSVITPDNSGLEQPELQLTFQLCIQPLIRMQPHSFQTNDERLACNQSNYRIGWPRDSKH